MIPKTCLSMAHTLLPCAWRFVFTMGQRLARRSSTIRTRPAAEAPGWQCILRGSKHACDLECPSHATPVQDTERSANLISPVQRLRRKHISRPRTSTRLLKDGPQWCRQGAREGSLSTNTVLRPSVYCTPYRVLRSIYTDKQITLLMWDSELGPTLIT
jgi:hypothetical protein